MNMIKNTFRRVLEENRGAVIPFLMAGDPDPESSFLLASELIRRGADILELGVPFSDPVADGPVIQRAGQRALASGTDIDAVFQIVSKLRSKSDIPIVLMTYYNPVFRYGEERFVQEALSAGADGLLVVDLPPEEGKSLFLKAKMSGLATILMDTPTTPTERQRRILKRAEGFIYCVSRRGITGARNDIPKDLRQKVLHLKKLSSLPVAVGFGLSTSSQVRTILSFADGAVIGSALVEAIEKKSSLPQKIKTAGQLMKQFRAAAIPSSPHPS